MSEVEMSGAGRGWQNTSPKCGFDIGGVSTTLSAHDETWSFTEKWPDELSY